jgi:hypothetical protein
MATRTVRLDEEAERMLAEPGADQNVRTQSEQQRKAQAATLGLFQRQPDDQQAEPERLGVDQQAGKRQQRQQVDRQGDDRQQAGGQARKAHGSVSCTSVRMR